MIDTRKAMEQALEALENRCGTNADERLPGGAIESLRSALSKAQHTEATDNLAEYLAGAFSISKDHAYNLMRHALSTAVTTATTT